MSDPEEAVAADADADAELEVTEPLRSVTITERQSQVMYYYQLLLPTGGRPTEREARIANLVCVSETTIRTELAVLRRLRLLPTARRPTLPAEIQMLAKSSASRPLPIRDPNEPDLTRVRFRAAARRYEHLRRRFETDPTLYLDAHDELYKAIVAHMAVHGARPMRCDGVQYWPVPGGFEFERRPLPDPPHRTEWIRKVPLRVPDAGSSQPGPKPIRQLPPLAHLVREDRALRQTTPRLTAQEYRAQQDVWNPPAPEATSDSDSDSDPDPDPDPVPVPEAVPAPEAAPDPEADAS